MRQFPRPRLGAAIVVALLMSPACGGGGSTGGTSTTTGDATPSTSAPAPATTSPEASNEGALGRHDAPPEGVKAQFEFFQEGDGSCFGLDESKPAAVVDFPNPQIAMTFVICFPGFAPNQPVEADVQLPDGTVRTVSVTTFNSPEGVPALSWTSVPGDPLGVYKVSARQGSISGTGSFTVGAAATPRTVGIPPLAGPPGTTFRFGLAGFVPNSVVDLYLYRSGENGVHTYLTTVPVTMDGDGQAILSLPTAAGDPEGAYCFVRRGPKAAPDYSCGLTFALT